MSELEYSIRVSDRALHARLRLNAQEGLVVTVPEGFDLGRVPELVNSKKDWIRRHQSTLRRHLATEPHEPRQPDEIFLRAVSEMWSVEYHETQDARVVGISRPKQRLLLFGSVRDASATDAALERWVARKAREQLVPWVWDTARQFDLPVRAVHVKSQRKRWASCSPRRTISLNLRLMFLPRHLVRYVLVHELMHLHEMNHSRRFWAHVRDAEPDFAALDHELRGAWRYVPTWLDRYARLDG